MKNLKRVFSMALATVMLLGTMAVANAADFNDADDIANVDAVDTMVALNIINGKDDGNFDPDGLVTRAEMAKMIATAMNGGVAPDFGTKPNPSFTDIKGHWAESFIEYCYSMKIISGRGNGIFDPAGNVTGVEAAKMVLTALGYDAEAFQLTGADWDTNVNYQATWTCNPSLYEELNGVNMFQPLTRDNAAQLIWNGVQNKTVVRTPDKTLGTGEIVYSYDITGDKLITLKYGALVKYAYLGEVSSYDEDKAEYTYSVDTTGITEDAFGAGSLKLEEDLSDLYLKKVKIVYKPGKAAGSVSKVYGVFAQDSSTMFSGVVGNVPGTLTTSDKKIKLSGTTYNLDNTIAATPVYEILNGVSSTYANLDDLSGVAAIAHYNMELIDMDGNGKGDAIIIYPFTVAQVTAVGKTSVSAGSSYKKDETNIYEGIAKNDWVKITAADNTADGKARIEEIELTTGTIDALKKSDGKVQVDGTWYTDADGASNTYTLNDEYNLVIVNGYVFNAEAVDATVNVADAVFVLKADDAAEAGSVNEGTQTVRLLFTDGSKKNVTVVDIDGDEPVESTKQVAPGETYIYAINDDGNYELTSVKTADFDAVKGGTAAIKVKSGKATNGTSVKDGAGTFRFNDDAVVFVANNDLSKVSVLTGEDVNDWGSTEYTTSTASGKTGSALYAKTSNGFDNVVLGTLILTETSVPGAAGDTVYGWLVSDSARVKKGTTNYLQMNIWNGTEEITVLAKTAAGSDLTSITSTTPNDFTAGTVIGYTVSGEYITNVDKLSDNANDYFEGAVKAYKEGGKDIEFANDSTIYTITDDTAIIFVDSEANEGYDTGSIQIADIDNGTEINNVIYYYDHTNSKHELKVIFVDVNNELK